TRSYAVLRPICRRRICREKALPAVRLEVAGLGSAGRIGTGCSICRCDSSTRWPLVGCLIRDLSIAGGGRYRPAHLGSLMRRLSATHGGVTHHSVVPT